MSGTNDAETTRTALTTADEGVAMDSAFRTLTLLAGLVIVGIIVVILGSLLLRAMPSIEQFGVGFLTSASWNSTKEQFGALPFISGTVLTSFMALILGAPVSIGIAVLLTQYTKGIVRETFVFLVELVAAIPSVIYGLWGLLFFAPIVDKYVIPAINATPLGVLPIFGQQSYSYNMLLASLVLALMITPIIASFSRESLIRVPTDQRDAGIALGLTRWEVITGVVLPYARTGIISAIILGLGRAIGETMAVTMLIGNKYQVTADFFSPGATMSSLLANEFNQSPSVLHNSALFEVGLVLFLVAFVVNSFARLAITRLSHEGSS
ncbi:phosphate ABC transporter permease subunit PstC [Haladaptatus sp.]|uniref:phosphate ABC transporter permease subunit PstC n=1 Tax=Haladaptatus sp. TaxID=1973141 RepID=UPI003C439CF8